MAIPRSTFIDILKDSYSAYYSIRERDEVPETELPLAFRADYSSRDERYWLTKSVKMWGNEKNEYAYVFISDSFSPELAERCRDWALEDGLPRAVVDGQKAVDLLYLNIRHDAGPGQPGMGRRFT